MCQARARAVEAILRAPDANRPHPTAIRGILSGNVSRRGAGPQRSQKRIASGETAPLQPAEDARSSLRNAPCSNKLTHRETGRLTQAHPRLSRRGPAPCRPAHRGGGSARPASEAAGIRIQGEDVGRIPRLAALAGQPETLVMGSPGSPLPRVCRYLKNSRTNARHTPHG